MHINPAEQEQVEELKRWWNTYGASIIIGIVLGATVLGGYKYWLYYNQVKSEEASVIYNELRADVAGKKLAPANERVQRLRSEYRRTPYAGLAALLAAKLNFDSGKTEQARELLEWAANNAKGPSVRATARLRLARILMESGQYDEALKVLDTEETGGYEAEFLEARGDVYLKKKDPAKAKQLYQQALSGLDRSAYREILQMKLDDLAPGA